MIILEAEEICFIKKICNSEVGRCYVEMWEINSDILNKRRTAEFTDVTSAECSFIFSIHFNHTIRTPLNTNNIPAEVILSIFKEVKFMWWRRILKRNCSQVVRFLAQFGCLEFASVASFCEAKLRSSLSHHMPRLTTEKEKKETKPALRSHFFIPPEVAHQDRKSIPFVIRSSSDIPRRAASSHEKTRNFPFLSSVPKVQSLELASN